MFGFLFSSSDIRTSGMVELSSRVKFTRKSEISDHKIDSPGGLDSLLKISFDIRYCNSCVRIFSDYDILFRSVSED
jgi:hypothetical protein